MDISTSTEIDDDILLSDSADSHDEDDFADEVIKDEETPLPTQHEGGDTKNNDTTPKIPKEILLTKEFALKGISKVSMTYKERENLKANLGKVVSLHLQKMGIMTMVPDGLEAFYSLAHLYLYDNKITKIDGLEYLPQLESLHLSGNRIGRIENLGSCVNLRRLYLGHNEIEVVEGLENLAMLLELHIEHQNLPPEQPLLFCPNSLDLISRKLKVLNISGNQLESIEDIMCMDVLDTLYASRNNLSDLDQVTVILKTLRQLRVVHLKDNLITKNPRYKEKIVGYLSRVEVLDGKDINEMTRSSLQRLCSIKAMRVRNQVKRVVPPKGRTSSGFGGYEGGIETNPSQPNMIISKQFSPEMMDQNLQSQSHFQFSTPISASPTHDQPQQNADNFMNSQYAMLIAGKGQRDSKRQILNANTGTVKFDLEKVYASRTSNRLDEEIEPDKMSEMAKIIFRLSNMSPSNPGSSVENYVKSRETSYWNGTGSGVGGGGSVSAIKESRPLSPLEETNNVRMTSSASKAFNIRKGAPAPMRRPMVRKLPPRNTLGAGRTLSPLEELPTPRDGNGSIHSMEEIFSQSFQTSTCTIPPWPHITRKKAFGPPKVIYMP